ncbi:hypothetical protein T439DRAFT_330695 [Meredithblackwellia eburnea MCA 4105]
MADSAPVFMKKGKGRPGGIRKREAQDDDNSQPEPSQVVIAQKKQINSHLVQGTNPLKRRKHQDSNNNIALSDSEDDKDGKESLFVRHSATTSRPRRRSSSPPAEVSAEVASAKSRQQQHDKQEIKDDGMYRGQAGQAHQLPKAFGPVKGGPGNVRTITLVDYQPDVCKDYKDADSSFFYSIQLETGFCGFGDTCKFLHDRGDYLHGWQLDNSFLSSSAAAGSFMAKQAARENGGATAGGGGDSDSDDEEDLPFACLICRNPFGKEPVVTLCGHYFDSSCAIKRFAKTGKCFACGKPTNGVFNKATKLIEKQKERERINEAIAAANAEGSDDEGGIEIEGVEDRSEPLASHSRVRRGDDDEEEEEGSEEEEEEPQRVRRRPIVEIEERGRRD